jgi:dephospho-CoA kinase
MMKVALTGNVASGKSALARIWARKGVPLVSADELAREAVQPGSPGLAAVVASFGVGVLKEDGSLDRDSLRHLVFRDPSKRRELEEILHPIIQARREEWMRREAGRGSRLVVAEIPLLFEVGLEEAFDAVVFVDAPYRERLRRLTELRGLEEEEARRILDAQMPPEEKLSRASFVVHNSGSMQELEIRGLALLDLLRARAAEKKDE